MPEQQRPKNTFQLNLGLNTESNEISFPDGYSTSEQNYELLIDGSRRRRKGCAQESGGSSYATGQTIGAAHAYATYKWRGVDGDSSKNFIVHQIGDQLFFTDDADTISTTFHSQSVSLAGYRVDAANVPTTTVEDAVCEFSQGRGVLLVTQKYLRPFYVTYNATSNEFTTEAVILQVRDFDGIEDGTPNQAAPSTITDDHRYNLRNRGWIEADIAAYFASEAKYPSKSHVWYKGYRRITDVGYSDLDGIQTFDPTKLAAEQFGQSSAAQGGLLLNPLDTRYSGSTTNEGVEVQISTIAVQTGTIQAGGTFRIVTASVHGRSSTDYVTISGTLLAVDVKIGGLTFNNAYKIDIDGYYEVTVVDTTTFDITFAETSSYFRWGTNVVEQAGQINGNVSLPKTGGAALSVGPTAVAYHAGRAWFAGIEDGEWADTVFFSKIALKPKSFGLCHQEGDPTNPEFNQLSSSDGGTIVIPNLGSVKRMLPLKDSLLIYTDRGVWEIGGGQRGVFTAGAYSVRKITEAECSSARTPLNTGDRAIYAGNRGIHVIAPNKYTRVLEETSLSDQLIKTLWNDIPTARKNVMQAVYDSSLDRIYYLYGDTGDNANHYANALVLDLRVGGYYKYVFNTTTTVGLLGAYALTVSDTSNSSKRLKWAAQSTNSVVTCDLAQTDYIDFDGAESPLPYVTTGWDNIGDFQRRRQAPVITVFAKRTETGYTATGDGWDGDNESSNLLTAYWDWTDDSVSGKIGSQNETYRHTRAFVPSSASDVNGYPVVTTRNKVRGRGRVLQLRFDGAATKDSHILGFTTNYKVSRGK